MGATASQEQLLARAIENQDIDGVKTLIKDLTKEERQRICTSLVPEDENKYTIFHYAAWQDNPELVTLLIDYVDDLEIRDGLQWTPLMTAVNRGSKENVKILLNHGAKIDCDSMKGMDLIAAAMSFNDVELVEILMDHGAQVTIPAGVEIDAENASSCHLLHFAADGGFTDIVRLLIKKGKIPINTLDQSGWSPLHVAAGHNYFEVVQVLLENGAEINIKDHDGNTPLAWAREMNAEEVITELEKRGAVADNEWHGEKVDLNKYSHPTEEDDHELQGIDNTEFEIEDSAEITTTTSDALQRQ